MWCNPEDFPLFGKTVDFPFGSLGINMCFEKRENGKVYLYIIHTRLVSVKRARDRPNSLNLCENTIGKFGMAFRAEPAESIIKIKENRTEKRERFFFRSQKKFLFHWIFVGDAPSRYNRVRFEHTWRRDSGEIYRFWGTSFTACRHHVVTWLARTWREHSKWSASLYTPAIYECCWKQFASPFLWHHSRMVLH